MARANRNIRSSPGQPSQHARAVASSPANTPRAVRPGRGNQDTSSDVRTARAPRWGGFLWHGEPFFPDLCQALDGLHASAIEASESQDHPGAQNESTLPPRA
jgi:hypothetical protein